MIYNKWKIWLENIVILFQSKQKQFDEGDEDDDDYDSFFEDEGDEDETSSDDELPAGGTRALTAAMFLKTEKYVFYIYI